ncbi:MAG: fibronectin type III domain-containing protein [bacterium]|nr:fibronectin type III domain-containing protein [bacterium]
MIRRLVLFTVILVVVIACDETPVFPGEGPTVPSNPSPALDATEQSLSLTLSWECSSPDGRPLTYDVYLGRDSQPPRVATDVAQPSYQAENLAPNRTYYWRIAARDDRGLVQDGPIWRFSTVSSAWEEYSSPTTRNLNGVSINGNSGWASGNNGTLLKLENGLWTETTVDPLLGLYGVCWDGTTGYCVGDFGKIIKLTDSGWTDETSPTTDALRAVAMDRNGGAWAVGGVGTVLRLVNGVWSTVSVPDTSGYTLYDVAVNDANEVLVTASGTTVFYWDGSVWADETATTDGNPGTADVLSAGYLVTGNLTGFWVGDSDGDMLYRSVVGSTVTWSDYGRPFAGGANGIGFEGGGFGMAAFDGGAVSRFDGASWATGENVSTADLNDVEPLSKGEAWAVGDGGVIYRYSPVE